jgi:serine phosphatase RsbU (regulator of sigma subunit)/anti-sigma regulatory factor (Ser/Thr protein kinase)
LPFANRHAPESLKMPFFRCEFQCSLPAARAATIDVREFLNREGISGQELDGWELAIAEAANNGVIYAREDRQENALALEVSIHDTLTEVRVWDHTEGFTLPSEVELPDFEEEGGRGIFLIKSLTDSAEYLRGSSSNCFVLKKKRSSPPSRVPRITVEQLENELSLMTEELAASYESLSAIFSFTSSLANATEPMDLVEPWMKELARVTGADWHSFFVVSPDKRALLCATKSCASIPHEIPLLNKGISNNAPSSAARATESRQDVWFDSSSPLSECDPLHSASRSTSGLLHSVYLGTSLVGLVALGRSVGEHPFTAGQVNVIHTFSDFLGTQVRHAEVQREATHNQLMRRDLEIAASIQQSLLPSRLPRSSGIEVFGSATSAREVGGDFYDVIGFPDGSMLLAIADVMGKGVPAALFAAILRTLVRSRNDIAAKPGLLLEWVAATLFEDFDRVEMFATMQLAYIDKPGRRVRVSGAGHCPLLIARPDREIVEVESEGVPVGILPESKFPESVHPIPPGSRLLLFTDGVTESRNSCGDQWGIERLKAWLSSAPEKSSQALGTALFQKIAVHRAGEPSTDDITFILLTTSDK